MTIDSFEVIVYTAYFLIPGFLIECISSTFVPSKRRTDAEKLLVYLGYSILNLVCWYWLFNCLFVKHGNETWYWFAVTLLCFASGLITGFVAGIFKKFNPFRTLVKKLGLFAYNPVPTAWEYKFSNCTEGEYLTIYLDNGKYVRGAFFNKSIASSDLGMRDIYLEEAYMLDKDDNWQPVSGSDGIWISPDAIKWISFTKKEGLHHDQKQG